ncbi:hypothetical protein AB5I41_20400 [Sphingomonas sp. MMS24-JH45]
MLGVLAFSAEMIRQHDLRKTRESGHWIELGARRARLRAAGAADGADGGVAVGVDVTGQTADFFYWRTRSPGC